MAAVLTAVSPLLIGNLVETRFDMALSAILVWTLWAAATERWRLAWGLLAAATLLKLVPLALIPVMMLWQAHRDSARRAWTGALCALAAVAVVIAPFAIMSPSGTWDIARYHLDRPLQVESIGSAYLLGLHALADVPVTIESSYGSQGLEGTGPAVIAAIMTAILIVLVIAIAWSFWLGLHRSRHPGDARLFVAAAAATMVALLVCGKVLSPQFIVWLLPVGFVIAGRFGPATAVATAAAMLLTFSYFPHRYWDLVAMQDGPIALLVLRDTALIALLAAPGRARASPGAPWDGCWGGNAPTRHGRSRRCGPATSSTEAHRRARRRRPESSGARVPARRTSSRARSGSDDGDPARVGQQALRGTGGPAPDGGLGAAVGDDGPHQLDGSVVAAVVAQHEGGLVAASTTAPMSYLAAGSGVAPSWPRPARPTAGIAHIARAAAATATRRRRRGAGVAADGRATRNTPSGARDAARA